MAPRLNGPVVLTGASGFIGKRIKDALADADLVTLRRRASPPGDERSYEVDYADVERLAAVMRQVRPAYVVHVAGVTKGVSYADFQRGNVLPTANLLAGLKRAEHRPQRFVFVSSLTSFGPSAPDRPLVETDDRQPIEYYGQSKAQAETVVEAETEIPWTILRPGGVYGPGDVDFFQHFQMAAKGWSVFFGNRQRLWSGIYIDDFVDAAFAAAESEATRQRGYFLGDTEPYSWEQFQRAVGEHAGRKVREMDLPEMFVSPVALMGEWMTALDRRPRVLNRQKAKMGAQAAWTCRSDAATRDFGFEARVGLTEGVKRSFAWYRDHGWLP